jgi:hypothetical protein
MNEFLLQVVQELNIHKQNFTTKPTGIKINENWLNNVLARGHVFVDRETQKRTIPAHLGGIPVTYDSSVDTYELVYGEGE